MENLVSNKDISIKHSEFYNNLDVGIAYFIISDNSPKPFSLFYGNPYFQKIISNKGLEGNEHKLVFNSEMDTYLQLKPIGYSEKIKHYCTFSKKWFQINLFIPDINIIWVGILDLAFYDPHIRNENIYKELVENQTEGVAIVDEFENFLFVNPATAKIFGVDVNNLIRKNLREFVNEQTFEFIKSQTQLRKKGKISSYEVTITRNDGSERIVLISSSPGFNQKNELNAIYAVFRDVTEWRKSETERDENLQLFETLVKELPDLVVIHEEGKISYCNNICFDFLGYAENEMIHTEIFQYIYPEDIPIAIEKFAQRKNNDSVEDYEIRLIHKNGNIIYVIVRGKSISYKGKPALMNVLIDITKSKENEKKLIDNERKYRLLADNSGDCIWYMDLDFKFQYISPSIERILGYSVEQALEKSIDDLLTPSSKELMYRVFADEMTLEMQGNVDPKRIREIELQEYRKDGKVIWLINTVTFIRDENNVPLGILGISKDISTQKEYEIFIEAQNEELVEARLKAERADKLKSIFLSNMSHEIRTPLNSIIGFSELLIDNSISDSEKREFVRMMQNSGNQLINLINDIIDITKIESGKLVLKSVKFDLHSFLMDIYKEFKPHFEREKPDVVLKIDLKLPQPYFVNTDSFRLKQVIDNLISNAFKFTHKGYVEIKCKKLSQSDVVEFSVSDTGIGIPSDKLDSVFDYFKQLSEGYNSIKFGGTGLGLSISKAILKMLGGNISVKSELYQGSTFMFSLPLFIESFDLSDSFALSPQKGICYSFSQKTALLVEDDLNGMKLLQNIVSSLDITCLSAETGLAAINILNSNAHFDVVFLDIRLPDMDGYEIAKLIKSSRPDIPIIAQSAHAFIEDKEKAELYGFSAYLTKPLVKGLIIKELNKLFY